MEHPAVNAQLISSIRQTRSVFLQSHGAEGVLPSVNVFAEHKIPVALSAPAVAA